MKLKKVLSMLLMIPILTLGASAMQEDYSAISDCLYKLYLIEEKPEDYSQNITRAEALKYFLSFSGIEVGKETGSSHFIDVEKRDTMAAYIEHAYMNGLVNGYSDNTYRPDDNMTVGQSAAVIENILGYGQLLQSGSYPDNVMQIASGIGITENMSVNPNADITIGELFEMLDNAKDIPPLEISISAANKSGYVDNDSTLLEKKHKIYYAKGTVTANEYTGLSDTDAIEGCIKIDGVEFTLSERCSEEKDYLGYYVEYYYYENKGEKVLLIAKPLEKTNIVTIDAKLINDFSDGKYSYYKNEEQDRLLYAKLSQYADVIYNGVADLHPDKYIPTEGSVRLIDNNGDNFYEVVIIEDYKTVFVGAVFAENKTIRDKNTDIEYSFDDKERRIEFYKDGVKTGFSSIADYNVLTVYESKQDSNNSLVRVYISDKTVDGEVLNISSENGMQFASISGVSYELNNYAIDYSRITLRDSGTFYLDINGRVAACKLAYRGGLQYGYLIKAYVGDEDDEVILKLLTESGKILYYTMNEKSTINGEKDSPENIISTLCVAANGRVYSKPAGQPVKFTANAYGEIKKLYTHNQTNGGSIDAAKERIVPVRLDYDNTVTYTPVTRNVDNRFLVSETAVTFCVPDVESQAAGKASDSDFTVADISKYPQWGYRLNAFDGDEMGVCSLILHVNVLGGNTLNNESCYYAMIGDISEVWSDEKDEKVLNLEVYSYGNKETLTIYSNTNVLGVSSADKLKKGSVVAYSKADNGEVACMNVVVSPDNCVPADTYDGNRSRNNVYVRGQVQKKNTNTLIISYEKNGDDYKHISDYGVADNTLWYVSTGTAPVYVYDKQKNNVKAYNNLSEIRDYEHYRDRASFVMVNMTYMGVHHIFVINE